MPSIDLSLPGRSSPWHSSWLRTKLDTHRHENEPRIGALIMPAGCFELHVWNQSTFAIFFSVFFAYVPYRTWKASCGRRDVAWIPSSPGRPQEAHHRIPQSRISHYHSGVFCVTVIMTRRLCWHPMYRCDASSVISGRHMEAHLGMKRISFQIDSEHQHPWNKIPCFVDSDFAFVTLRDMLASSEHF